MAGRKSGANVFELANRVAINNGINDTTGVADSLADHQSGSNNNAHQINNISGLQAALNELETALNGKQNIISGYTGTIDIIVSVDFMAQTVTSKTVNVSNGIITSIA